MAVITKRKSEPDRAIVIWSIRYARRSVLSLMSRLLALRIRRSYSVIDFKGNDPRFVATTCCEIRFSDYQTEEGGGTRPWTGMYCMGS